MSHIIRELPDGTTAIYAWFMAMHTRVDVLLKAADSTLLMPAVHDMRQLIGEIEAAGNRFAPTSQLATLNCNGQMVFTHPEDHLYRMISQCLRFNALTLGLFDITVSSRSHSPHTIDLVHLTADTIYFDEPTVSLDLCGFIKGYALDQIKPMLAAHGIADAIVNMGNSSVLAMGHVPGKFTGCLTTSGNDTPTRRHIVNPITGQWVEGRRQVSVRTLGGAEGEVLATSVLLADDRQLLQLKRNFQIEAINYQ